MVNTHLKWIAWDTAENIIQLVPRKKADRKFPRKYNQHLVVAVFTNGSLRLGYSSDPRALIETIIHWARNIGKPDLASVLVSDAHDFSQSRMRYLWVDRILKKRFHYEIMEFKNLDLQMAISLFPEGFTCDPLPPSPDISNICIKPNFSAFTQEGIVMQNKQNDITDANPSEYLAHQLNFNENLSQEESLIIAGTIIHQDDEGRFCLNELHKAAGGDEKLRPTFWLRNEQTQCLVNAIEKNCAGTSVQKCTSEQNQAVRVINGGKSPGTYVCKELVYAYAMWISPEFNLAIIRAFDEMVTGRFQKKLESIKQNQISNAHAGQFPDVVERAIEAKAWRIAEEHRKSTLSIMGTVMSGSDEFCWNVAFQIKHSVVLRLKNMAENWLLKYKPAPVAEMIMDWEPQSGRY